MKRISPLSFLATLWAATVSFAAVPSLINYQGRLTDSSGEPVVGAKAFSVSIYDAPTSGNLLYTESIGSVTLDSKGIYSFQFGDTGSSSSAASEAVATTDGALSTFNKVLTNTPIIAGSLSVTDGTYTWDQTNGSSDDGEFGVAYSEALGRVTVIYYSGAPTAGADISTTYSHTTTGITGALSSGAAHWLELTVDGVAQTTRDRVLAVPFAARAAVADSLPTVDVDYPINIFGTNNYLPKQTGGVDSGKPMTLWHIIDTDLKEITSAQVMASCKGEYSYDAWAFMRIISIDNDGVKHTIAQDGIDSPKETAEIVSRLLKIEGSFPLDHKNFQYVLELGIGTASGTHQTVSSYSRVSNCRLKGIK